jgi:hypothetical protein
MFPTKTIRLPDRKKRGYGPSWPSENYQAHNRKPALAAPASGRVNFRPNGLKLPLHFNTKLIGGVYRSGDGRMKLCLSDRQIVVGLVYAGDEENKIGVLQLPPCIWKRPFVKSA